MKQYRLRADSIWRVEDGHLMVLHPRTRAGRFYHAKASSAVSPDGTIEPRPEAGRLLRDLHAMGLLEQASERVGHDREQGSPGQAPDAHADALPAGGRGAALSAPLNVTIQVTNACNLTCAHCHDPGARVRHMKYEDFRALVTELRSMRVFNVNLSGGEAMLHRRIVDMVGLVYSLGMKVTMSTNCTLADLAKVTALREAGLRQVHISLDSHDPVQHDLMRGHEGSFRRMTSNLGHLRAVGIEYTLVTTLRGQTVADYEATIDKAFELGASAHKTNTLVPQGRGHVLEMPSFDLTRDYIAAFRRKQAEYAGRFRLLAETMFHLQMSTSGGPGGPSSTRCGLSRRHHDLRGKRARRRHALLLLHGTDGRQRGEGRLPDDLGGQSPLQ